MTHGDLDHLRKTYFFPTGVQARIPTEDVTILSIHPDEVAFYEAAFPARLRFPVHPIIRRILSFYNICPTQHSPNAWQCVICILVIWLFYRRHMSLNEFRCIYTLFKNPKPDSGWLYLRRGRARTYLRDHRATLKDGRTDSSSSLEMIGKFFRILLQTKFLGSYKYGATQVSIIFTTCLFIVYHLAIKIISMLLFLGKRCNKLPLLTDTKEARTRRVLRK